MGYFFYPMSNIDLKPVEQTFWHRVIARASVSGCTVNILVFICPEFQKTGHECFREVVLVCFYSTEIIDLCREWHIVGQSILWGTQEMMLKREFEMDSQSMRGCSAMQMCLYCVTLGCVELYCIVLVDPYKRLKGSYINVFVPLCSTWICQKISLVCRWI